MASCTHQHLVLLPGHSPRVRCRHCHLTINKEELGNSFCPECFESSGRRRADFEPVEHPAEEATRYRCEDCGVLITCE
jgi:predicted RNA-binding Zn-ribbon protein involved in translation (DUF1610 family)